MPNQLNISPERDEAALKEKAAEAKATLERATAMLEKGSLKVEDARYVDQLFNTMIATEKTMCW